jgi:transposase
MHATTVAIDLAKDVFEVAVRVGDDIRARHRFSRPQFSKFIETLSPETIVVMEACGSAHYWARRCQSRGMVVRLLPPRYVRPYVRRNKTDRADTEAMLEADRGGGIHPVAVKTAEQQTIQALHRVRQQWQKTRTARINLIRAVLREQGIACPVGAVTLQRRAAVLIADDEVVLPELTRETVHWILEELRAVEERLTALDRRLQRIARTHPIAARLTTVPGIGIITATAFVAAVPHIHGFRRGRQFASWLGLTPRERSSGTRRILGSISKRGDRYLRTLLAHGARSILRAALHRRRTGQALMRLEEWTLTLADRRGHNRTTIALANKLARVIWAVWSRDQEFVAAAA